MSDKFYCPHSELLLFSAKQIMGRWQAVDKVIFMDKKQNFYGVTNTEMLTFKILICNITFYEVNIYLYENYFWISVIMSKNKPLKPFLRA